LERKAIFIFFAINSEKTGGFINIAPNVLNRYRKSVSAKKIHAAQADNRGKSSKISFIIDIENQFLLKKFT
jgi:hypothetical protein